MKSLTIENYPYVKILRDYMKLNQKLQEVDVIIVPGSSDDSYISKVVQLYQQGYAHHIICSGKGSLYVDKGYIETEAEHFSGLLIKQGIPEDAIILESKATSTGENIRLSYEIMKENNWNSCTIIQKPFFERRSYATALHEQHDGRRPEFIIVGSSDITIEQYDIINTLPFLWISMMIGDFHRVRVCNQQGWIIYQEIPDDVCDAYLKLVEMGYDQLLMKGYSIW